MGTPTSITASREAFVEKSMNRRMKEASDRVQLAHDMARRMEAGASYNIEDFMFVATLGDPENYAHEYANLVEASTLKEGQIVGLKRSGLLRCMGVTTANPLIMDVSGVRGSGNIQDNRRMEARLLLSLAVRRSAEDSRVPRTDIQVPVTPYSATLLRGVGEPSHGHRAFYEPHELVVGTTALLEHITENTDPIGVQQLAKFTELTVAMHTTKG